MGLVRLVVFGFLFLSIVYLSLSWFSRSVRREKLEREFDASPIDGETRDDYVAKGIEAYNNSIRPKLLLLVYVLPTLFVIALIYFTNN